LQLLRVRIGIERKQASDLACNAADLAAELAVAQCAADRAAHRLTDLPDEIADPSLRCELALALLLLFQLLILRQLCVRHCYRIGAEWQNGAADAARDLSDLTAQSRIAQQPAYAFAYQPAQRRAEQTAEKSLGRELRAFASVARNILLKLIHVRPLYIVRLQSGKQADREVWMCIRPA
jgi:hypothetical protein